MSKRGNIKKPSASSERLVRAFAVLQEALPFEQQLPRVLEGARDEIGVDRLVVWAASPDSDQLIHVAGSGLSEHDRLSLGERMEIPLNKAGAMAEVYHSKLPLVVDQTHPLPPQLRLKQPYSNIKALRTKSFFVVPITASGRVLGVMVGDNKYCRIRLPADTLHLLPFLALYLATAVELQTRDRTLADVLDQQAATRDILRVISGSPTDLKAVLDAVAENAARLCQAEDVIITRVQGERLKVAAHFGSFPIVIGEEGLPMDRSTGSGRAVLDRCLIHLPDVLAESDAEFGFLKGLARKSDIRTVLVAPLLREEEAIGTISIRRLTVSPFTDRQIELLKTFADQAAIAIQNVHLFTETNEALERQTATAEILRVIASSPSDVQPVFDAIARSARQLLGGHSALVVQRADDVLHLAAFTGTNESGDEALQRLFPTKLTGQGALGKAVLSGEPAWVTDVEADPAYSSAFREGARTRGFRALLAVPMIRVGHSIGGIAVTRREPGAFTETQIKLLQTFADQAVIAIQNTRLFTELQERNKSLTEALEQQTATSEILRVISQSQRDVQPVFEAVAANARKLCEATLATVSTFDGELIHIAAADGFTPEGIEALRNTFPRPLGRLGDTAMGRAVLTRDVVYIQDVREDAEYRLQGHAQTVGFLSALSVPMFRDGSPIGAITVNGAEPAMFSERQIAMLQTFADQAVIAIENTRLFTELQERLEQQTATSEILRVISQSQQNVQPVFDAIATNARKLCGATFGAVNTFDGELIDVVAADGFSPDAIKAIQRTYPKPPNRDGATGRSILDRAVCYLPDIREDAAYRLQVIADAAGYRSALSVPMLREGSPIGSIAVSGPEPAMFSEKQIAMLQTFADQAVIAIENTRLFNELQQRNEALREALDQQTATSEILRVISRSPTDLQPVLDAVVQNAARLCDARDAFLGRVDGDFLRVVAQYGSLPNTPREEGYLRTRDLAGGRAVMERAIVHIPDLVAEGDAEWSGAKGFGARFGYRAILAVPMIRDGAAIGTIGIRRVEPGPFSDQHIELLKTFADQAVIAIENTRLFHELQERLEQQTATSDILRVISQSQQDVHPVFEAIAVSARKLCRGTTGWVGTFDGELIHHVAASGYSPEAVEAIKRTFPASPGRGLIAGRAILMRDVVYIPDVRDDPEYDRKELADRVGFRSVAAVPMLREGRPIGTVNVTGAEPAMFSERQIAMLQTFADQAVIAVENTRLFNELQTRNRDLTEALEQQTATSDILRVISQSHRDVQPVFEAIAANARKLCEATMGAVFRFDGELVHVAATEGLDAEGLDVHRRVFPIAPAGGTATGRAIESKSVVYIPDVAADASYRFRDESLAANNRSLLAVPMMRDGSPIGTVNVAGARPAMFSERQITMLGTFADQAVIAIENSRLFNELQARTAELTRSVEELKALGEVGNALSSTLDVDTVLTTILTRANQLAGTQMGQIYDYDEATEELRPRATFGYIKEIDDAVRRNPLRKGEGVTGQSVLKRQPIQVTDITLESIYESRLRDLAIASGFRAVLAVPLIREDQVLGALTIARTKPGEFPPQVIDLMTTFASQSALAMQNARLFHQLEIASKHKSQFLANMSHELRTPLNAILGYTELIVDHVYGEVPEKINEVLDRVQHSGRHLLGLINDVLDLSKIEAGQLTLSLSTYSFTDVVQAVVTAVGSLAAEKQLRLTVNVAPNLPVGQGDVRRLTQVLLNLVGNAIKFTERGEVAVRVRVPDGAFLVAVTDTGPGIKKEDQEKIFEEFQQSDTAVAKSKSGTGLGLAIAKRIVELHGGRIWVESVLGQGSTFFVSVPINAERKDVAA